MADNSYDNYANLRLKLNIRIIFYASKSALSAANASRVLTVE